MKHRILIVEDSATQAEALRTLLDESGYEAEVARSGEQALERLSGASFDLVLSDVMMGGMTGFDLASRVKEDPAHRDLPVVLLTSLSDPMDIVRGLECGADNYITKPYEADHLLRRVRHVLDNRRLRAGSKTSLGVSVRFMGRDLTITSDREQILDLFIASVEDVVRTNEVLQRRERQLAEAHERLAAVAREKTREASVSTERYRALLQNAGDAILMADREGRILEVNRRTADLLRRRPEELVGTSVDELTVERTMDFSTLTELLRGQGQMSLGERRLLDATGGTIWCDLNASLSEIDGEELILVIARDVTERKASERALAETNQRLEALIDASPLAIVALDGEGRVELWSQAAERMFGWSAGEVLGQLPPLVPEESVSDFCTLLDRVLAGESIDGVERQRVRKDGQLLEVSLFADPIRDQSGAIVGCMGVVADITERKRAERALRATEEAERANRAKSEFLSRMSHELRTPLNAILGFAQLLEYEVESEEDVESVTQILEAGRHLLQLVDEVLDLSAIEAGRLALSLQPVPLGELLGEAAALVGSLAQQRGIRIRCDAAEGAPVVSADPQRLKQVVLNLLSNAIKYNREGGRVEVTCEPREGGRVRLLVRDEGPGIPTELIPRLFIPFDRLGAEREGVEGTGLGLVLSKSLMEAMGGELGLETAVGGGSTFWVELSLASESSADRPGPPARDFPRRRESGVRRRVLFIEDNLSNVRLLERLFSRQAGVELSCAMQGSIGLQLAREQRPDIILLDLNLPDMSGKEVLRRLKDDPDLCGTPVVMVSGDAMSSQIDHVLGLGADAYVTKPFDLQELLDVLESCVAGKQLPSE